MPTLGIDIETYSEVDLPKCGVYAYAEHADCRVLADALDDKHIPPVAGKLALVFPGDALVAEQGFDGVDILIQHLFRCAVEVGMVTSKNGTRKRRPFPSDV